MGGQEIKAVLEKDTNDSLKCNLTAREETKTAKQKTIKPIYSRNKHSNSIIARLINSRAILYNIVPS